MFELLLAPVVCGACALAAVAFLVVASGLGLVGMALARRRGFLCFPGEVR